MERLPTCGRERVFNSLTRQLMPEPDRSAFQIKHTAINAHVQCGEIIRANGRDDPLLDLVGYDSYKLHEAPRLGSVARHSPEYRRRNACWRSRRVAGEYFGEKERVAACDHMQAPSWATCL